MTDRDLQAAWQVFRLALRYDAGVYAKEYLPRVGSLPLEPTDPERLEPLVRGVLAALDGDAVAEEASPVLRAFRQTFRPTVEQKDRRKLAKAFEAYARAWRARATP